MWRIGGYGRDRLPFGAAVGDQAGDGQHGVFEVFATPDVALQRPPLLRFGDRVFASRITKTVRFAEAPVKGMSVLKYDPDGKAAYAYRQLAKEVLGNGQR